MEIPNAKLITVKSSSSSEDENEDVSITMNKSFSDFPDAHPTREVTVFGNCAPIHSPRPPLLQFETRSQRCGTIKVNTESLESHTLEEIVEIDEEEEGDSEDQCCKDSQDEHIIEIESPTMMPVGRSEEGSHGHCGPGLHSTSTTMVADSEEQQMGSFEDEVSTALEWFRSIFNELGKDDCITVRDFKQAATGYDVRQATLHVVLELFALPL